VKKLDLTRLPDFVDELGRPVYRLAQPRGLWHDMSEELLRAPVAAGYSHAADEAIFRAVAAELRRMSRERPLDILEIGGGTGHFFDRVRDVSRSYINVEPGDAPVDQAMLVRLEDPAYAAIRCTAEDIPIPNATVDVVIAVASLDHVPDYDAALREIERCLRAAGEVVLVLNNAASWWKSLLRGSKRLRAREAQISADHFIQWSAAECAAELGRVFTDVRARTIRYLPYVPMLWHVLGPIAEVVGPRVLPLSGGDTIATARRRQRDS
jgi:ubiquinone/menaquinone biosynthesis C-methylase UbiE